MALTHSTDLSTADHLLLVPVGAHEQHGPHLPLDTDTVIAVSLCERVASARAAGDAMTSIVVAPAVAISASDEHAGFPGTLSLTTETTAEVLIHLARSALANASTCIGVLFVNAHGGNADAVTRARSRWSDDSTRADVWSLPAFPDGDAHAGRTETSLMLALRPDSVRRHDAVGGDLRPVTSTIGLMRTGGVRAVSDNGVLGDPSGASAEEGGRLLADAVAALLDTIERLERRWSAARRQ